MLYLVGNFATTPILEKVVRNSQCMERFPSEFVDVITIHLLNNVAIQC